MNPVGKNISLNLKLLRKSLGWSLDNVAERTGVSKAMLGQIEREESSPTIVTLWKIAKGLRVPFSIFLEKPRKPRRKDIQTIPERWLNSPDGKMLVNPIFPFNPELRCEVFIIQLLPEYEHVSVAHDKGIVEHVIVNSGTMELLANGVWNTLSAGEGMQFHADQEHSYRNPSSNEPITFINIVHYPK